MDDHPIDVWSDWHHLSGACPRQAPRIAVCLGEATSADSFAILGHVNDHPVDQTA